MKLTNYIRDAVVENAMRKAGIYDQEAACKADRVVWANAVADESLGGAEAIQLLDAANKKVAKIVASLPKHLQEDVRLGPLTSSIVGTFAGCRHYINEWDGSRPAKNVLLDAEHPLSIEFFALEARKTDLSKKRGDLRTDVRAALNSVTTVARLLKVWPEVKELLPTSAAPTTNLPAVKVEHLNAAIGLPTENQGVTQ